MGGELSYFDGALRRLLHKRNEKVLQSIAHVVCVLASDEDESDGGISDASWQGRAGAGLGNGGRGRGSCQGAAAGCTSYFRFMLFQWYVF